MGKKYKVVATGGTFDVLHSGHYKLLEKSFEIGEHIIIGLASDNFASRSGKILVNNYFKRRHKLRNFIDEMFGEQNYRISRLENFYGPTVISNDVQAIVTSAETRSNAVKINEIRVRNGFPEMKIISVTMVRAQDGKILSSKRIRSGEVDKFGSVCKAKA